MPAGPRLAGRPFGPSPWERRRFPGRWGQPRGRSWGGGSFRERRFGRARAASRDNGAAPAGGGGPARPEPCGTDPNHILSRACGDRSRFPGGYFIPSGGYKGLPGDHSFPSGGCNSPPGDHEGFYGKHFIPSGDHKSLSGGHKDGSGDHNSLSGDHKDLPGEYSFPSGGCKGPSGGIRRWKGIRMGLRLRATALRGLRRRILSPVFSQGMAPPGKPGGAEGKQLRSGPAPNRRLKGETVLPGCSPAQAAAGPSKAAQRRSARRVPAGTSSDLLAVTRLAPLASDKPASSYIARLSPRRPASKAPPCPVGVYGTYIPYRPLGPSALGNLGGLR